MINQIDISFTSHTLRPRRAAGSRGTRIRSVWPRVRRSPEEMQDHVGAHLPHLIHVTGGQARPSHLHFCIQNSRYILRLQLCPRRGLERTRKRDWANDVLWEDLPFAEGRTHPPLAFRRAGSFFPACLKSVLALHPMGVELKCAAVAKRNIKRSTRKTQRHQPQGNIHSPPIIESERIPKTNLMISYLQAGFAVSSFFFSFISLCLNK